MDLILPKYSVTEPTWFYLSLLLIVAVFFRFNRFWSLRNLDIVLLLSISPGLLLVKNPDLEPFGYAWLFAGTGIFLLRLFCDSVFTRRPRLEQNMNASGLTFLAVATFAFLMAKVIIEPPPKSTVETVRRAENILQRQEATQASSAEEEQPGPTTPLLTMPVVPTSKFVAANDRSARSQTLRGFERIAACSVAIIAHLSVILGLIVFGKRHIGDLHIGLGMAAMYLLLPCTAYDIGRVNHVLPSALILWAFNSYRMPMVAGALMGLACGSLFFPVFLLPLWATFYGKHGAIRFGMSLCLVGAILMGSLMLTSADTYSFTRQLIGSIDWSVVEFRGNDAAGFWSSHDPAYRIPIAAAFVVMVLILSIWPFQKNLEHLISHSVAIVVATQLWYPRQGGLYLLWYVPLLLLVVFRPRLAHLVPPRNESRLATTESLVRPAATDRPISLGPTVNSRLFR